MAAGQTWPRGPLRGPALGGSYVGLYTQGEQLRAPRRSHAPVNERSGKFHTRPQLIGIKGVLPYNPRNVGTVYVPLALTSEIVGGCLSPTSVFC